MNMNYHVLFIIKNIEKRHMMTILKYGSKLRLAVFLISTSLSSLQYIFQAFIIGNFITAATNADLIGKRIQPTRRGFKTQKEAKQAMEELKKNYSDSQNIYL